MALTSTDWLLSSGWRQGLFTHCIEDLTQPIPFNVEAKEEGCYPSRDVCEYTKFIQIQLAIHKNSTPQTQPIPNNQMNSFVFRFSLQFI